MNIQLYFLPINSNSLAHYFGKGIILPSRYYNNKVSDIQNRIGSALLLSDKRWVKNSDCSLELSLTEKEEKSLIRISDHFSILLSPLPISRVKAVFFLNNEQSKTTIWNINNGAAFLPDRLIKIENPQESDFIYDNEIIDLKEQEEIADFARKAKYFDHMLGGFSLIRIAGEPDMNYSQNYFNSLAFLNERIKQDVLKAQSEKAIRFTEDFSGLFIKSNNKWSKWQSYFYQPISLSEVESIAADEGINIHKKLGVPQLDRIDQNSILYDLIVLATYGEGKNKSIDNFVNDVLNEKVLSFKKEELSLLVGLNNGYSSLRNKYKFSNATKTVKFELQSRLDYYIIESIFQYAFNSIKGNLDFDYIDHWVGESTAAKPSKNSYKIIDKWITPKKKAKIFSPDYLEELFQSSTSRNIYQSISNAATNWFPPFVIKNEAECIKYFEKTLKDSINEWQKAIMDQIKVDHESVLEKQKDEIFNQIQYEKDLLQEKIMTLTDEMFKLRKEIEEFNQRPKKQKTVKTYKIAEEEKNILKEVETGEMNYDLLSAVRLKEVAKEKGIKPIPKTREELLKAIKSVRTFL